MNTTATKTELNQSNETRAVQSEIDALSEQLAANHTKLSWTDPVYWKGVQAGPCRNCRKPRITRNGLCWICEHPNEQA